MVKWHNIDPENWPSVSTQGNDKDEHAVFVYFKYPFEDLDILHELERQLIHVIEDNNLGEYDFHEIELMEGDGTLFMYGPNAEAIFKAVKPVLDETDWLKSAEAVLRFGPTWEASHIEVKIGDN